MYKPMELVEEIRQHPTDPNLSLVAAKIIEDLPHRGGFLVSDEIDAILLDCQVYVE